MATPATTPNRANRPVVGIAATVRRIDLPYVSLDGHVVFDDYVRRVAEAGGLPVLLPVVDPHLAGSLLGAVDALVLTGGVDVDPAAYGATPALDDEPHDPRRDRFELALVAAAAAAGTPVLGVCRGMHVLNVAAGGTLTGHVDGHRALDLRHDLAVAPGTLLDGIVGPGLATGSLHHQAVDALGAGLRVAATAPDGVVEAIEAGDGQPVLGVQWHPELEAGPAGDPVWRWLVEVAGR